MGANQLKLDSRAEAPDIEMATTETDTSLNLLPDVDARWTEPEQMDLDDADGTSALKEVVEGVKSGVGKIGWCRGARRAH